MKKFLLAVIALAFLSTIAFAQWQVPQNNVPYGRGVGTGFSSAAAANNSVLITGASGIPALSQTLPSAVQGNITQLSGLTILTTNTTFWVRTDGNDSNTCLTDSAGGACLTWQGAYDKFQLNYFANNKTVTIKQGTATGQSGVKTYAPGSGVNVLSITGGWLGGGALIFEGDNTTPSNVVWQTSGGADVARLGSNVQFPNITFKGFKIVSAKDGIRHDATGLVNIGNMELGASAGAGFGTGFGGALLVLQSGTTVAVTGNVDKVVDLDSGFGFLQGTITGNGSTAVEFLVSRFMGRLYVASAFSGTLVGARYGVRNGGHIQYDSSAGTLLGSTTPSPSGGGTFEDTAAGTAILGISKIDFLANDITMNATAGTLTFVGADTNGYVFDNKITSIAASSSGGAFNSKYPSSIDGLSLQPSGSDTATAVRFRRVDGTTVGSIDVTSSTTTYSTSSDARLKDDLKPLNAGPIIDALKLFDFRWKGTAERGAGVLAQDVHKVFPEAVSVPARAEEMWGVDYSKFVPLLIAEIKELRKRVEILEKR